MNIHVSYCIHKGMGIDLQPDSLVAGSGFFEKPIHQPWSWSQIGLLKLLQQPRESVDSDQPMREGQHRYSDE